MKIITSLFFTMLLSWSASLNALVKPEEIGPELKDWMVTLYLENDEFDLFIPICKGVLIDPEWILSSEGCFFDPLEFVNRLLSRDSSRMVAIIGQGSDSIEIEKNVHDSDSGLIMFRLATPADAEVIFMEPLDFELSLGQEVFILGYEQSDDIRHPQGNPDGDYDVSCKVEGGVLDYIGENSICYVLAYPNISTGLLAARGTLIDPDEQTAPDGFYDSFVNNEGNNSRLYIDFRETGNYFCVEDIGSPVVTRKTNGDYTLAGIVVSAGPSMGMFTCNPSMLNSVASLAGFLDFIYTTKADYLFQEECPAVPVLTLEQQLGNDISLQWEAVANTDGYRLVLSEALGYADLEVIELGNTTTYSVSLDLDLNYSLALQAYNGKCTSQLSESLKVSTFE